MTTEGETPPETEDLDPAALRGMLLPFGPPFFARQLARFLRDHCPDPAEGLPRVELHLVGGESLELCHVVGLAPLWAAVAVRDERDMAQMRTELVPYESIARVTVRPPHDREGRIGFRADHVPSALTDDSAMPAVLLGAAACAPDASAPRDRG